MLPCSHHSIIFIILLLPILYIPSIQAQVEYPGTLFSEDHWILKSSFVRTFTLPPLSNNELMVAAAQTDNMNPGPSRFAEAVEVPIGLEDGDWSVDEKTGLRAWRLQISSPGAITLSLLFEEFYIPAGGEFYVIGRNETRGAFTSVNNNDDGKFAIAPIKGDLLTLHYTGPAKEQPRIKLYKVVHGFNKILLTHGASGSCNIDVACGPHPTAPHVHSVGMLLTDDHQRYCSGALINNVRRDGKQYFLTANHCVFSDVSYFIVGFNYLYENCPKHQARGLLGKRMEPKAKLVQGLRLAAAWDRTDFALLEIKEKIPDDYNVYMSGFDLSNELATDVHGLHHPSGDVMKISTYKGKLVPASWSEAPDSFHLQVPAWTAGVTERGSSGSPLFNAQGLIVGHLRGGQSSCDFPTGYDLYGGIAYDWTRPEKSSNQLAEHLNPDGEKNVRVVEGGFMKDLRK